MAKLADQVAIVTGASRGIGKAIAKTLAKNGANVVVNYVTSEAKAQKLVDEIREHGGQSVAIKANVAVPEEAEKLVKETIQTFGKLDILVNNAGITRDKTLKKMTTEQWDEVIQVNLNGVYQCTRAALPYLTKSSHGRIINISSIIGQSGGFGQTNYAAAKAGMIGFTKSLALELARQNVTVNAICPGFIDTDMVADMPDKVLESIKEKIPLGRLGEAKEVANAVLYLCENGGYVTGQSLNINGGLYM